MKKLDKYLIFSRHYNFISEEELSIEAIGQKADGLFKCDTSITPPFFVITSSLFDLWVNNNHQGEKILSELLTTRPEFISPQNASYFIVRSSAKHETFEERGYYKSSRGNISFGNLYNTIKEVYTENIANISKYPDNSFAIIIQQFIRPKLTGHLSNERRVGKRPNQWLLEIVNNKNDLIDKERFATLVSPESFTLLNLQANNKQDLKIKLKSLATKITSQGKRSHLEWVWDGLNIWVVQNDLESNQEMGEEPGSLWKRSKQIVETPILKCFKTVATTKNNWKKIKCIRTFMECGLPSGEVYILEDPKIIKKLLTGIIDQNLKNDLQWLLLDPIVIRMDIQKPDGYNNILLPRTETLFTGEQAINFLIQKTKLFFDQGLNENDFCFLMHRFIISKSCALAFSKPNIQKARIDSTWGIVDGLYYHPHDSFEVSLIRREPKIQKQLRCKTEYLDINSEGVWFSKRSGIKYDWASSLRKQQILEIAKYNVAISDFLDSPVTVMYFVDVDQSTGYPSILPWFYTTEEITESSEKFTDVIFSETRELIQSELDFGAFKKKAEDGTIGKITIKLKLNPDTLRDKDLIESIGEFAKQKNIPIEMEGSILSHTYYILRKIGARVRCVDSFEPKYKKEKFFKLVRDKIPINIELKGEKARTVKIDSNQLLNYLKGKAVEEAYEFYWEEEHDKIIEELADIYEVIRASCRIFGISMEELEVIADKKTEKKGGFEAGVLLVDTTESSLIDVIDRSGKSLLLENDELPLSKFRKSKPKKVSFGMDSSISLPYLLVGEKSEAVEINVPMSFGETEHLRISYTSKGIKIVFLKKKENLNQNIQIGLFDS